MSTKAYRRNYPGPFAAVTLIAALFSGCGGKTLVAPAPGRPAMESLTISGAVQRPLALDRQTLLEFPTVTARLNDVHRDGQYHGVFFYRGVPLRLLLDQAGVVKTGGLFNRELDLAIVARSRLGEVAVLSWGEVFYRNPAEVLLALEATPHHPHKACDKCHAPEESKPWLDELARQVPMPKLIVTRDFYTERCIEDVISIEVIALGADHGLHVEKGKGPKPLFAPSFELRGLGKTPLVFESPKGYPRRAVEAIQAGDGTGYHGIKHFEGVSLRAVLEKLGVTPDPAGALLLSSPDGYRVLLSNAEVLTAQDGELLVLADRKDGQPESDGGRFHLVIPTDLSADRWLKSVARIDILRALPTQTP